MYHNLAEIGFALREAVEHGVMTRREAWVVSKLNTNKAASPSPSLLPPRTTSAIYSPPLPNQEWRGQSVHDAQGALASVRETLQPLA